METISGPRVTRNSETTPSDADPNPIRAELIGMHQATAAGVTVSGRNSPVTALCRALLEAGHPDSPLEAYRGTTLCLRVRSIREGAKLTVYDNSIGRPVFGPYKAWETSAAASPVRETAASPPCLPAKAPARMPGARS